MANAGRITTTKPLPLDIIQKIREHIRDDLRASAYFNISVNSGIRVGDLLAMRLEHVTWNEGLATLEWKESKTGKRREVPLNQLASASLTRWLAVRPCKTDFIFVGTRGRQRSAYYSTLLKSWCEAVGYTSSRISNHSCRKSFVRVNIERGANLVVMQKMLNHSTPAQTLEYACIMDSDIKKIYASVI